MEMVRMEQPLAPFDGEKINRIREKIKLVFGRESLMDDALLLKRYTLTVEGDLVMIIR
jgi:hypothetical protein